MQLIVKVFPKSNRERIVNKNGIIKVYVKEPPDKGKANKAVIELVAERCGVKKNSVKIISGLTSRKKIIEILGGNV